MITKRSLYPRQFFILQTASNEFIRDMISNKGKVARRMILKKEEEIITE